MFNYTKVTYKSLITRFGLWLNTKLTKKYGMDYYNHVLNYSVNGMYPEETSPYYIMGCVTVLCLFEKSDPSHSITSVYGPYFGKNYAQGPIKEKWDIGSFLFNSGERMFKARIDHECIHKEI